MSTVSTDKINIPFVILIGGKSKRFGSDKGIYEFFGKPLLLHQIETLSHFKRNIFIIAHSISQVKLYQEKIPISKNYTFILDTEDSVPNPSIRTPMLGMCSAFKTLIEKEYEKAFVLSCDMPLIKKEVIEFLIKQSFGYDCCIPRWNSGFLEPLCTIYPIKETFLRAKIKLKNKKFKLTNLLDKDWKINYTSIENLIKPLDEKLFTFLNINYLKDVQKLLQICKEK